MFPFARGVSERGHGHPDGVPVQKVELKTDAMRSRIDYYLLAPLSVRSLSKIAHI
jgi:hypothetical protein